MFSRGLCGPSNPIPPRGTMKRSTLVRVLVLAVLASSVVAGLSLLPVKQYLTSLLEWVYGIGNWGAFVLSAFYVPACLLFLPGSIFTLGSGFAFGVVRGTIAVSLGSVLGATAAFLTGRTLARGLIAQKVMRNAQFRAIDQAVCEQGFKIVLLTRLSPVVPFNLLNYAFGLTKVGFREFVLASWIGMLPGAVMYVYVGSAVKSLADLVADKVDGGYAQKLLFVA